jgi:symplekin
MTPKSKVLVKSMEKTTRMVLLHLAKRYDDLYYYVLTVWHILTKTRDPHNPLAPRMQQHIERLMRARSEILDDTNRKRALDQATGAADVKRQRVDEPTAPRLDIKPLSAGPHSLGAVFTITNNLGLQGFDATQVPASLAARICVTSLATINQDAFDQAIQVMPRTRSLRS